MPAMPHARDRQRLLLTMMARRRLDAVVLGRAEHVDWATGHRPAHRQHESAVLLRADGRATLFTANGPDADAAADEAVAFEANWDGTVRQEQAFGSSPTWLASGSRGTTGSASTRRPISAWCQDWPTRRPSRSTTSCSNSGGPSGRTSWP